jgi:polyhydroxyalkanoate synthesis regulator phasin
MESSDRYEDFEGWLASPHYPDQLMLYLQDIYARQQADMDDLQAQIQRLRQQLTE